MSKIRSGHIIIADTQFLVAETVKNLILADPRYSLAGMVTTRKELLDLLKKDGNSLLIADFESLDCTIPEDLKMFQTEFPELKMLVLTNFISKTVFQTLSRSGIRNIVYKNIDREELFSAIQATLKGKKFYSHEIIDQYLEVNENRIQMEDSRNLTASEIEIVKMIANGLTTKEIASKRIISTHTVSTHRKNIFKKIAVSNASELIIHAIKAGWIDNIEYYI